MLLRQLVDYIIVLMEFIELMIHMVLISTVLWIHHLSKLVIHIMLQLMGFEILIVCTKVLMEFIELLLPTDYLLMHTSVVRQSKLVVHTI